ncbi:hypothetical protein [Tateyamaria sp.]
MRTLVQTAGIALLMMPTGAWAQHTEDQVGTLLLEIGDFDKSTFVGSGLLKREFLQFDEDETSYLLHIGERRYPVKLDDGRGTSLRAKSCDKAEFIGLNSSLGCPISFEAEYNVEMSDDGVSVALTIWNVEFQ